MHLLSSGCAIVCYEIILVISNRTRAARSFEIMPYDFRPNFTPLSSITIINIITGVYDHDLFCRVLKLGPWNNFNPNHMFSELENNHK